MLYHYSSTSMPFDSEIKCHCKLSLQTATTDSTHSKPNIDLIIFITETPAWVCTVAV